jgi:hypothetical protein
MKVGLTGSRQLAASTALLEGALAQARITCVIPRITLVDSIDNSGPHILLRQVILGNRYRTHSTEWSSLVNSLGRSNLVSLQLVFQYSNGYVRSQCAVMPFGYSGYILLRRDTDIPASFVPRLSLAWLRSPAGTSYYRTRLLTFS